MFDKLFHHTKKHIDKIQTSIQAASSTETIKNNTKPKETTKHKESVPHEHRSIVNISTASVIKASFIILTIFYLTQIIGEIGDIFILLFISWIIASAVDPFADYFEEKGINRGITGTIILTMIFGSLGLMIAYVFPVFITQLIDFTQDIIGKFSHINSVEDIPFYDIARPYLEKYLGGNEGEVVGALQNHFGQASQGIKNIGENAFTALMGLFGGIVSAASVFIMSLYMIMDEKNLENFVRTLTPLQYENNVIKMMRDIQKKMGAWFRAEIYLMLIMGITTWIVYSLMGVQFAATFGILAGLMELIPVIGVFIAGAPAIIVGFLQDPLIGLGVVIFILVLQTIEGNVLVPVLMKHSVGISPLTVLVAMLIGGQLMGIMGVILAVPFATMLSVFINSYTDANEKKKHKNEEVDEIDV